MFLFPLIYISSFLYSLKQLLNRNKQGIFIFFIFGLSIYTTALSTTLQLGFKDLIPFLQPFKEILVLLAVGIAIWDFKGKFKLQTIDVLILIYIGYTFLYVLLPIGNLGFLEKLVAFKSATFFGFVYLAGRLTKLSEINISKYFQYFLLLFFAATVILFFEKILDQHFQTLTGYADYNFYFFNQEPSGNHGLTWTFETASGLKRFASFFANPLEFGAATLLTLAIIASLYTQDNNKFTPTPLGYAALGATIICILLAISRASLASYFIMIYMYALLTSNRLMVKGIYILVIVSVVYFIFFLLIVNPDLYDLIYETITFTNNSSVGHIIAWLEGLNTLITAPFGLGLGSSGIIAESAGGGTGGENQFLIIGVQTGIISILLYISIYVALIKSCWKWHNKLAGKARKVAIALILLRIGYIIPLFTSELESSVFISYTIWFISGLYVGIIADSQQQTITSVNHETD